MGNYYFTAIDLTPCFPSSVAATVRGSLITHRGNTQIDHHRAWISDALHTSILLKKVLDSHYLTWIQGLYIYDSFLVTDQTGRRVMSTPPASPSRAEQTVCSPEGKMWPIKKEIEKNSAWKTFNTVRMCLGMPRLGSGMFALLFPFCNWPNATARYFHCSLNGVLCRSNEKFCSQLSGRCRAPPEWRGSCPRSTIRQREIPPKSSALAEGHNEKRCCNRRHAPVFR